MFDLIISSAITSSTYFCIALFKGLAPYSLSNPFSAINVLAFFVSFNLKPISEILSYNFLSSISIIFSISSFSKLLNTTTSSILFKNSGAKAFFKAFSITRREFVLSCFFGLKFQNQLRFQSLSAFSPQHLRS